MATNNNTTTTTTTKPSKKKKSSQNPETNFLINLNSYSKSKDLQSAISLYESQHQNLRLNLHHFNSLLYLCSNSASNADTESLAFDYGFRIFRQMLSKNITPNEATITAVARLSAAKGDGDYAFEVVKNMGEYGIAPRLRTYDPALLCFCRNLEADKAYEVEEHMGSNGVGLEEAEIAGLLRVSAETGRVERVYGYLHNLRSNVRCVSEETGKIVEDWFRSEKGCGVGGGGGGVGVVVREVVERNGGGWHGLGWIGEGKWVVRRGSVEESGRCCCCGEHLVCVDIDEVERERFARSVAGLAMEREVKGNFTEFQVRNKVLVSVFEGFRKLHDS